jgi:hypothetical protein
MQKLAFAFAAAALVACAAPARAQQDPATIVVQDPTAAAPGKWKAGGSIEFWVVRESQPGPAGGSIERNLQLGGANLFVGYADWTLQYTQRSGGGDFSGSNTPANFTGNAQRTEDEVVLRWLINALGTRYFVPYVLAGYSWIDSKRTFNSTDGTAFACSGTTNQEARVKFDAPTVGLGAVFTITQNIGVRADARYKPYKVTAHADGCADVSGNGDGGDFTVTGYYNFGGGWNAQLGARSQTLPGISNAPAGASESLRSTGLFGMVGYSYFF